MRWFFIVRPINFTYGISVCRILRLGITAVAGLVTSSMIRLARDTIFFREIHVVLLLIRDELSPWLKGAQIFMALALRFW